MSDPDADSTPDRGSAADRTDASAGTADAKNATDTVDADASSGTVGSSETVGSIVNRLSSAVPSTVRGNFAPSMIRGSFRVKFVVSILLIVVALSVVGGLGYVDAERTVESDAEDQLTATVDMHADSINEWMISMESHTRSVSSSSELAGTEAEEAEAQVIQQQATLPVDVRGVHVIDTNENEILTSTNGELRSESLSAVDEPWTEIEPGVDLTAANDVWHSESAYQSGTLDDQVMSFASPVEGDEARIAVVVGTIEYRVDGLKQLHDDQETMILDTDGQTVLASDDLGGDPDEDVIAELGTKRDGTEFDRGGDGLVTAYAATADNNWVAVTTVPEEQAFAASRAVGWAVLFVIGAALISLLVGGYLLARQTVTPLEDLRDRAERMKNGDLSVDLETNRIDEVGQLYRAFDEMRDTLRAQITEAEEAQAEAEAAKVEAETAQVEAEEAQTEAEAERERVENVMDELRRAADRYGTTMRAAAEGDLTIRADVRTDNEQMAAIGREFNEMLAEIDRAVAEVKRFAEDVRAASEQVDASSAEVRRASEQVAESIQEISDSSERQSEKLQTVESELAGLSASTEEIASTATQVEGVAERTVDSSHRGREAAEEAISEMEDVETEADRAVETIRSLEAEVEQIDELVEAISDVADQTNLLALNASIEAARAGNGGNADGFGTVAQEIKSLSADAKETAAEIDARIESIREKTDESVGVVEKTSDRVEQGTAAVEPAVESLTEIAEYAEETNDGVQEISAATDQQADATEQMVTAVDEIATSSEDAAAEAGNVSAAAEEQTASLTGVTENVNSLAEQAAELSETLERFETAAGPSDGDRDAHSRPSAATDGGSDALGR